MIAQQFGIVKVSATELLQNDIRTNDQNAEAIQKAFDEGTPVSDQIINPLVEKRLRQNDCSINGWVLEGYPENRSQMNFLTTMIRKTPSQVFVLEQPEGESVSRIQSRRLDPETGHTYNLAVAGPSDPAVRERLIE